MSALRLVRKTGRCVNGAERDGGNIVHIASLNDWGPALCGTRPGRRSCGWGPPMGGNEAIVTCHRCIKRNGGKGWGWSSERREALAIGATS